MFTRSSKAIEKYLARYAEAEADQVTAIPDVFGHALVIPALDESEGLKELLWHIPQGPLGKVLVIVVVNATAAAGSDVHERSHCLIVELKQIFGALKPGLHGEGIQWLGHPRGALLVIDRATAGRHFPPSQGVGLARKIGCDIALRLWWGKRILSPWIHTTDADVRLPSDYFFRLLAVAEMAQAAAALYPFWHEVEPVPELAQAMRLYELFLRYYVLGLAHAGSPYAFQSLGSTLAVHSADYARVRGFPARAAGEDFYLLNKLSKVGAIVRLVGEPIRIRGRASSRVPFGTGRSLQQITATLSRGQSFKTYAPEVFEYLGIWLRAMSCVTDEELKVERLSPTIDAELLWAALDEIGAKVAIEDARARSTSPGALRRHMHTWFDAFRTMKLIHVLTRRGLGTRELTAALTSASFVGAEAAQFQNLDSMRRELALREEGLAHRMGPAAWFQAGRGPVNGVPRHGARTEWLRPIGFKTGGAE